MKGRQQPVSPEVCKYWEANGFVTVYEPSGVLHFMAADVWTSGLAKGDFEGWSRRQ
jgi:hypothetical protein